MENSRVKILVTGSKGQLGSELRALSGQFSRLDFTFTDVDELDITNEASVSEYIKRLSPDYVLNCAAYTAVDRAEKEVELATSINAVAPGFIARACKGSGSKMIHISTDYVFDGESMIPYTEDFPVIPTSQYGITKLKGEEAVLKEGIAMIIRTSWLYASYGVNFVKTIINNAKIKPELRVVSDQMGNPTYARDLAEAILNIVSDGKAKFLPEIFHYSNQGICSWFNFATEIVTFSGLNCIVTPIESWDYPSAVKRPKYSVLSKEKICSTYNIKIPHWKNSLGNCIEILRKEGLI
jgi:dTDP-4-dehydrorhamnose reductase